MASEHWTEALFLRHPEAFLAILESAWESGERQSKDLHAVFDRFGVPAAGRVLDAPCGIGRHATRLGAMGYRVVGVDLAPVYLARARELAEQMGVSDRVRFREGDLRRLSEAFPESEAPFDAAVNLWTSLGYYGEAADDRILQEYAKLVRPGGLLVLSIVNRDHVVRHHAAQAYEAYGDFVVVSQERFDLTSSGMRNEWRFFRQRGENLEHVVTVPIAHRVYSLHELIRLLGAAGWQVEAAFGGLGMDPPSVDSRTLVVAARR